MKLLQLQENLNLDSRTQVIISLIIMNKTTNISLDKKLNIAYYYLNSNGLADTSKLTIDFEKYRCSRCIFIIGLLSTEFVKKNTFNNEKKIKIKLIQLYQYLDYLVRKYQIDIHKLSNIVFESILSYYTKTIIDPHTVTYPDFTTTKLNIKENLNKYVSIIIFEKNINLAKSQIFISFLNIMFQEKVIKDYLILFKKDENKDKIKECEQTLIELQVIYKKFINEQVELFNFDYANEHDKIDIIQLSVDNYLKSIITL